MFGEFVGFFFDIVFVAAVSAASAQQNVEVFVNKVLRLWQKITRKRIVKSDLVFGSARRLGRNGDVRIPGEHVKAVENLVPIQHLAEPAHQVVAAHHPQRIQRRSNQACHAQRANGVDGEFVVEQIGCFGCDDEHDALKGCVKQCVDVGINAGIARGVEVQMEPRNHRRDPVHDLMRREKSGLRDD
mmetsp:Transcript_11387/g.20576  ORF Transcript_11387/g.20576 Transcript_11387/m.20576 type:complete len:186 (-) Transcript_11387:1081-1638(-)